MLKHLTIIMILVSLFSFGCSSKESKVPLLSQSTEDDAVKQTQRVTKQRTTSVPFKQLKQTKIKLHLDPPLTDEMQIKLKKAFDQHLTAEDWKIIESAASEYDVSDVGTQLALISQSPTILTNKNLKNALEDLFSRYPYGMPRLDQEKIMQERMNNLLEAAR